MSTHPISDRPLARITRRATAVLVTAALPATALFALAAPAHAEPVPSPAHAAALGSRSAVLPTAQHADGIKVGSGSYAATPPDTITDSAAVQATLDQHLYLDPSQAGKPVPTNQWWTDLLVNKYSGRMWADPLVSSTSEAGTTVSYPNSWNADGSEMEVSHGVTVSGDVVPVPDSSDEVLGDFENGLPSGWTSTGNAFTGTSSDSGTGQSAVSGWLGRGYLSSWVAKGGDSATGTITSPTFTIDQSTLAFLIAGGQYPDQQAVQLLVDGKVVDSATGTQSEQFRWVKWDLAALGGKQAQLRVVDSMNAGWGHVMVDQVMLTNNPETVAKRYSTIFRATEADALRWGDWNVSWRMPQDGPGGQYMDVTSAQGDPYEWFEYHGETPRLTLENGATLTDGDGTPLTFPFTGDRFEIRQNGHVFGVHAPEHTTFTKTGNAIQASAGTRYLVLSAVPKDGLTLDQLQKYAFAVPRDTRMDYSYDAVKGQVEQRWSATTDALQGTNHDTVQGWLQHQYADTTNNLAFTGATYDTPRGTMKTTVGHGGWTLDYAFSGVTPIGGTPDMSDKTDFAAKMRTYLADYSTVAWKGGDTYWDGKNVLQLAEYMTVAKQLGDSDSEEKLESTLEGALSDWYTYTEGEKENFFARYPTWKALIGFADSYGSAQFNDNHFHYGYFATATALLGAVDPDWIQKYEGMAKLVTDEYADSDRDDQDFPHLRTFDVWEGHSNAGGVSGPNGNNQESSSEAIQSEAGLFLLGSVLGDEDMQATGAMEYVTERAAVRDYYQNVRGNPASAMADGNGAFPSAYTHGQVGILQDGGNANATYFSHDPAWIYGIQWMPTAPWFNYFGWDKKFSQSIMQKMMSERPGVLGGDVAPNAADDIQMLTKLWWGVGTNGKDIITEDRSAAIGKLEDAVRAAERNHPGYVMAETAANPLYDAASGTHYVSLDANGKVAFPTAYWTPKTLPTALVPAQLSGPDADKKPKDWPVQSPLLPYFSTDYSPDAATIKQLYSVDLTNYQPGSDTAHAAAVFSDMGDALGEVVLGFLAQYDPATYADIHAALWKDKDPAVTGKSMAGMVYYQGMSNLELGTEITTRHTSDPLSQVYRGADGTYSYVLDNVDDVQHSYDVFDGAKVIGSIAVPARTQITSHLDAHLVKVAVTAKGDPATIVPGSKTAFTATGYDQYGATIPLSDVTWSATTGTITADGVYDATTRTDSASVSAKVIGISGSVRFRVAPAPVLTTIAVTPGSRQLVVGTPQQFEAAGRDQYGDPLRLPEASTWSYTGPGSVTNDGTVTTDALGSGYVVAASGGVEGTAIASSVATLADVALHASVTASSTLAPNSAKLTVDGDDTKTRWESAHGVDDVDLTADLGQETDISRVGITWENAAAKEYDLQVAHAATGPWRTVREVTKGDASADDLTLSETARFVRMHGISRQTAYGYSIYGFHVFGTPAESTITPTTVLVSPRTTDVLPGGTVPLTAYGFDAEGNGGTVTADAGATWAITGGGSVGGDGTVTAASKSGTTSAVTATIGDETGTAIVSTIDNAGTPTPTPTPTPGDGSGIDRDVAIGKPVTTSSNERADLAGAQAVDGDETTRWASDSHDAEWLAVDLGQVLPLDSVELDWESAYAKTYTVQVRDSADEPWRAVVDESAGNGGTDTHTLSDVSARYVRMLGGVRKTSYGYSLYEFRVFSKQGAATPDLAKGAATSSSSDESTSVPARNATDGDDQSRWASGHTDDQWLEVDLGSARALKSATIGWEGAYGSAYLIEGRKSASDGWTTLASVTNGDGGTDSADLDGSWRYVRLQGTRRATAYGYSLYSFELH